MRIRFTRKTQIKQKVPYVSFPSLEWGEVLHVYESPEGSFVIRNKRFEFQISNLEREFLMHYIFFIRRRFCVEEMVFKFVYLKIFHNETDVHSAVVWNNV